MVCKTWGKGSCGNSPTQDQRKEPKSENNFKKKEKAISLCPNQLNHTIKGASSIGNSTYCELTTDCTYTHTLRLEPVCALIFLTGRGRLETTFFFFFLILFGLCCVVCGISVSQLGTEPRSLQWKYWILTTGPPGNSLDSCLDWNKTWARHHFNLLCHCSCFPPTLMPRPSHLQTDALWLGGSQDTWTLETCCWVPKKDCRKLGNHWTTTTRSINEAQIMGLDKKK